MKIRNWIIRKLEAEVEPTAGHIDLENLDENKREELFKQFGEGDDNLTKFLKTAYEHNAPSLFCCSGHGRQSAYVVLKVNENNIELLRKIGKVLSKHGVITNFTNDHIKGKYVDYRSKYIGTEWLDLGSQIMENPEKYDDSNPDIFYHEEIYPSYKPLGFDLMKKLLNYLRKKDIKQLKNRK